LDFLGGMKSELHEMFRRGLVRRGYLATKTGQPICVMSS
jgi:hypothetical protein